MNGRSSCAILLMFSRALVTQRRCRERAPSAPFALASYEWTEPIERPRGGPRHGFGGHDSPAETERLLPAAPQQRGALHRAGGARSGGEPVPSRADDDVGRNARSPAGGAVNGIGSQTQKPLAIVVIGGSLILAILTRVVQPPLLGVAHTWLERRFGGRGGSTPHLSEEDDHFVT
jgi:hypothetical protein